ncbi:MAG TPA: hypothetical protein DEP23_07070 [Ruminococcaceae bacterium]|nr:hypothetical protein [Oscillospiraceae bacterium]
MNRTILFRGKREDNGEWVEGNLYISNMSGCYILQCKSFAKETKDGLKMGDKVVSFEVLPESVEQYIGLTDKNGVKIFEGDVIRAKGKRVFFIEYCCAITSYAARSTDGGPTAPCVNRGTMQVYEVIGNIHDNPELLGGDGD